MYRLHLSPKIWLRNAFCYYRENVPVTDRQIETERERGGLYECCPLVRTDCTAKATHIFLSKNKIQHICVSLDVNFNESLTNDIVSFEQLGPGLK